MSHNISDSKQDHMEEIFSRLIIDGMSHAFAISKEESYDTGEWIYRIYNFREDLHKLIEENLYLNIRESMQQASYALNSGNDLSARIQIQKLINIWKEHWDGSGTN